MDIKTTLATISSYVASIGLMLGETMHWMNDNAAGIGAITAIVTCLSHLYYQHKNAQNKQ